jgi:hypothetical protein
MKFKAKCQNIFMTKIMSIDIFSLFEPLYSVQKYIFLFKETKVLVVN